MKKYIVIFLCSLLLTGCWDSRNIEDLSLVIGVGLDKPEEENVEVTQRDSDPSKSKFPAVDIKQSDKGDFHFRGNRSPSLKDGVVKKPPRFLPALAYHAVFRSAVKGRHSA